MKYFIVSEKELVEAVEHFEDSDYCSIAYIERLVKEKQTVEILESGTVKGDFGYDLGDKLVKYYGKYVGIFIEVPK